jgi:hypothetical protein
MRQLHRHYDLGLPLPPCGQVRSRFIDRMFHVKLLKG